MSRRSCGPALVIVLCSGCGEIREVPVQAGDAAATTASTEASGESSETSISETQASASSGGPSTSGSTGGTASGEGAGSAGSEREIVCSSTPAFIDRATGEAAIELMVEGIGTATDLDVSVRLYHEAVGRVRIDLERGVQRSITLFPLLDRTICTPDLSVRFDGDSELDAADACELESTDGTDVVVAPAGDLAAILAGDADGAWRLLVTDSRDAPQGELATVCLSFATEA